MSKLIEAFANASLDLGFFIDHVLARDRVVFLDFHFTGGITLVFVGRVEMTGASCGLKFDFFTHGLTPQYRNASAKPLRRERAYR